MTAKWESIEDLITESTEYQSTWWKFDAAARAIVANPAAHPGVAGAVAAAANADEVVTTDAIYQRPTTHATSAQYLPERVRLHHRIAADFVPERGPLDSPRVFFTVGTFGVGKTTVLRGLVQRYRARQWPPDAQSQAGVFDNCALIDAGAVRRKLPEYADGLGSLVVQNEAFHITYDVVLPSALESRVDVIYDTLGRLASLRPVLDDFVGAGYALHLLRASAPLAVCQERTVQRALREEGRVVNPSLIRRAAADAEETMGALITERFPLAGWLHVDTTDPANPQPVDGTSDWLAVVPQT